MIWYSNSEGRFGANGAKGDLGEAIVEEYCKKNGIKFEDKNDRNSQVVLKIDCLINGVPVDVKANIFKGHLAVELWTRKNEPGWLYTTTAKEIYGVDVDTKSIYRYNVEQMKHHVKMNRKHAKKSKKGDVLMWVSVETISIIERIQ
jgi:hypothetical protein